MEANAHAICNADAKLCVRSVGRFVIPTGGGLMLHLCQFSRCRQSAVTPCWVVMILLVNCHAHLGIFCSSDRAIRVKRDHRREAP